MEYINNFNGEYREDEHVLFQTTDVAFSVGYNGVKTNWYLSGEGY